MTRAIRHAVVFTMTRAIKSKQHTAIEASLAGQGVDVVTPPLMERAAFSALFEFGGDLRTIPAQGRMEGAAENAAAFAKAVYRAAGGGPPMSSNPSPFSIDLAALKSRRKDSSPAAVDQADIAGERHGFVDREPRGKPGRRPSPRTGQVHAKVMPEVARQIAEEAARRGVQQGVLIEEAWALYRAQHR